ncbi:MAG: efflux RND transporter periplasmic adaptor subunit [Alphaproteobacteria bacterium]
MKFFNLIIKLKEKGKSLFLGISCLLILGSSYLLFHAIIFSPPTPSKKILYWIDAMEPQIHYDHPGKSRMNMELTPVYEESQQDNKKTGQPTIAISPAVINSLGVRTAMVEEGPLTPTVRAFGTIKADEDKVIHIHSYVEGWIQKLYARESQEWVEKDQPLFEIYSSDLRLAQMEYLLTSQVNGQVDGKNSLGKLRSLGVSEKQIEELKKTKQSRPWVTIYAPMRGYVDTLNIREGMWVKPEMTIMSLTDLSQVWGIAEIFPSQLAFVKIGQEAKITLPQQSGQSWQGKVDYIYPDIDPISLTAKVRIRLSNPEFLFKPNMSVAVEIQAPSKQVLQIPEEAIIWESEGQHVIVALGEGKFQPRKVLVGMAEESGQIEIVSGLKKGETVVTSAQFLLNSEVNMKSALQRLESPPHSPNHPSMDHAHMAGHGS